MIAPAVTKIEKASEYVDGNRPAMTSENIESTIANPILSLKSIQLLHLTNHTTYITFCSINNIGIIFSISHFMKF